MDKVAGGIEDYKGCLELHSKTCYNGPKEALVEKGAIKMAHPTMNNQRTGH